jgi:hypothetical protein
MEPAVGAVLLICAFLTLMAVGAATFAAAVSFLVVYKLGKQMEREVTELPRRLDKAILKTVEIYVKPYKEYMDEHGEALAQPVSPEEYLNDTSAEEGKTWLYS